MPDAPRCPHCGSPLPTMLAQHWRVTGGDLACPRCAKTIPESLLRQLFRSRE